MSTDFPIDQVRAETPGCASLLHLNNAGAALAPQVVLDAVTEYLHAEARTGAYRLADERAEALESVYHHASALFGGKPENWAFVESATRAWNAAFSALRFEPGDRVLTTTAEYPSNMAGLLRAQELQGIEIEVVGDDGDGQVDVAALESMLDERTRLVSVTHVPTQGGLVNPAEQIGALLRDTPVLYQVDACQSVGQLPVTVEEIGCDILSFTGRKFLRGPRATGMVWASDAALAQMGNPAGVDMRGSTWDAPMTITPLPSATRFEPYEIFFAGKVGLAAALEYAAEIGIDRIAERIAALSTQLRDGLDQIPGVGTHDKGIHRSAIVTFSVEGNDPTELQQQLRHRSINVSVAVQGSARLDFPDRNLDTLVRASVHYYNSAEEIDTFIATIAELSLR